MNIHIKKNKIMKKFKIFAAIAAAGVTLYGLYKVFKKRYYDDTLEELYGTPEPEENKESDGEEKESKS